MKHFSLILLLLAASLSLSQAHDKSVLAAASLSLSHAHDKSVLAAASLSLSHATDNSVLAASLSVSHAPGNSVDIEKVKQLEIGQVWDISVKIKEGMVTWDNYESKHGFTTGYRPQIKDHVISTKIVNVTNHIGTHIDAPGHVDEKVMGSPQGTVDGIDLAILNGPALVVQVPEGNNITADVLQSMNIPRGVKRVLFRTDNSDKDLFAKTYFTSNYTGFTADGARWLVQNTDIKFVGIDFLSVAIREQVYETHKEFLAVPQCKIVPVEGLYLTKVTPGWYIVNCLPLNVQGVEGAPTRCILSSLKTELLKC